MINAINVLSNTSIFAVAGDDCFVNIFKVENDMSLRLMGNFDLQNKLPVGVVLVNEKERNVDCLVTTYDNPHLVYLENCFTL